MARKVKVKSEDFDQGDDSYKSKASSPTTPKRTTRSSSKRPANVAKLSDRSPNLYKKHKTAVKPAPVQDEKDESDEGDSTGEYTEGMEEDKNGSHSGGTDDDDEKLVEKQLASVQKEQRQKAEMKLNELHLKQREENRRREQERFERLAKHRKEKEKQLKELEENNRREQERLELLEKQRKEKEAQEKERLEEEQHRMKRERQQQERIDMYNRVKERMDLERLEKEQKEAKELHDRQLAEEQKAQKKDAAAKSLRQEAEDDDDEDSDDGDSDDEGSDEDSGDEDDGDEEDGDKNEDDEDEDDDDESKEEEEDEDKDEQEDKNLVGADAPNLANPGNEDPCACIRCIKNLAIDPLYSCDFTDNPDKCAQCTNRGRSCNPVSFAFPYPFRIAINIVRSLLLSMEPRADCWLSKNSTTLPTRGSVKHSAYVYRPRPPRLPKRSASKDLVTGRPKTTLIAPSCLGKSVLSITRRKLSSCSASYW